MRQTRMASGVRRRTSRRATSRSRCARRARPGAGSPACIQVDLYRNQARGNPLADVLRTSRQRRQPGRACNRNGRSAVWRLDGLRQAVRDPGQVAGTSQRSGPAGLERGRHVRALRTERQQPGTAAESGRLLRAAGPPAASISANGTGFTRDSVDAGWIGLRTPHHAEAGQPEPGDLHRAGSTRS